MRRPLRLLVRLGIVLLVVLVATLVGVLWSLRQVPDWYAKAVEKRDPARLRAQSEQMEERLADLASGARATGSWQVVFTEEQVNAWLAAGLQQKHPDALPADFADPRVNIAPDGITLACRLRRPGLQPVVSLKVDVYLAEPNVVALRIRRVRAGRLPWPLDEVLSGISRTAGELELPLHWKISDGNPVALFPVPPIDGKRVRIDSLQLDDGRLYVAGTTR